MCSLVVHKEYKEKVYLTLEVRVRNKLSMFVVKMPKLVISFTDNEEKQNCSKQLDCNKNFSRDSAHTINTESILRKK